MLFYVKCDCAKSLFCFRFYAEERGVKVYLESPDIELVVKRQSVSIKLNLEIYLDPEIYEIGLRPELQKLNYAFIYLNPDYQMNLPIQTH